MSEPLLQCRSLTQVYRVGGSEVIALQGLDLEIAPGERVGVVGASGSGKSTLVQVISGLVRPTGGEVVFDGSALHTLGRGELERHRRERLGFVWQETDRNLLPHLSARHNVMLPMRLAGLADADDRATALLERVGLGDRADHTPLTLSGGEQQRVALATALAHGPKLLLADEPTGALDRTTTRETFALMRELAAERGAAQLIVSHDRELTAFVDRVVSIRDGRVATERRHDDGGTTEVVVVDRVARIQLGDDHLAALGDTDRLVAEIGDGAVTFRPAPEVDDA